MVWRGTPRPSRDFRDRDFPGDQREGIGREALSGIQRGTLDFRYKGYGCWKSPFDLALYLRLLQAQAPRTIIELGSGQGGSALWFADMTEALGAPATIYSYDIRPVTNIDHHRIVFDYGDIEHLEVSGLQEVISSCERPLLVVEDGPHTYDSCFAALEFCDPYLRMGDYIVIEDGIVAQLGLDEYEDGPQRAIAAFVETRASRYLVDRSYCDYYGPNVTWNPNGYLKRM